MSLSGARPMVVEPDGAVERSPGRTARATAVAKFNTSVLRSATCLVGVVGRSSGGGPAGEAECERQPWAVGVADVDRLPAANVHGVHPTPPTNIPFMLWLSIATH